MQNEIIYRCKTTVNHPTKTTPSEFVDWYPCGSLMEAKEVQAEDMNRYGIPLQFTEAVWTECDSVTLKPIQH